MASKEKRSIAVGIERTRRGIARASRVCITTHLPFYPHQEPPQESSKREDANAKAAEPEEEITRVTLGRDGSLGFDAIEIAVVSGASSDEEDEPPPSKKAKVEAPKKPKKSPATALSTANRVGGASSSTATSATDSTTDRPNHPDETRDDEATESTNGADDYADEESHDPFGTGWHAPDDDTGEWNGIVDFSKPWVAYETPGDSEEVSRMKRERARSSADRLRLGGDPYGDYTRRENGHA